MQLRDWIIEEKELCLKEKKYEDELQNYGAFLILYPPKRMTSFMSFDRSCRGLVVECPFLCHKATDLMQGLVNQCGIQTPTSEFVPQ